MAYQSPSPGAQQQYATPEHGYAQQQQQPFQQAAPQYYQHVSQDQIQPYQQPAQSQQPVQQHQYGSQPQMTSQQYAQGGNVNQQEWSNSLFDCTPAESCFMGCCCPCILLGKTSERIRDPTMASYEMFNTDCLLMCGIMYLTGCGFVYAMLKRNEIRERFGIKGDGTSDCCTAYWCGCCALIQQDKEVEKRVAAGPIAQGYQPNKEGMQMPSQAPQYTGKQ